MKKFAPKQLLNIYHSLWPFFGAVIYGFPSFAPPPPSATGGRGKAIEGRPSSKIKVIGITGTNGKTTVVHLTTAILEAAGYKVGSISSLRFKIGDKEWKNELKMTMPGRMKMQKFLRQAVKAGCQYAVLEVTSEGIKQYRHKFIDFDVAVFTNLTPEHIESHGGFENYKKAKGELFKIAKSAVVNLDDPNSDYFSALCAGKKYGYSTYNNKLEITTSMPGEFNLSNALAAAYVGISQGIDVGIIRKTIENFKGVPGRMEVVVREPFLVIVDYAHTPDSLQKVYRAIKDGDKRQAISDKLICVLGAAGGGRDKWKRSQMGKIAAQYCDQIILTNEDPYSENPSEILEEIEKGITSYKLQVTSYSKILDRREAIKKALQDARRGDTVIITGKGAEPWMMTRRGRVPWDDRKIVRE